MDKIKEIKEIKDWIEQNREWLPIKYLLSRNKELEEGIEKVLKWRGLDGDGISDPLRKELYGLVRKEIIERIKNVNTK